MPSLVQAFRHADTGTWSYVVADPVKARAAVIDPVLDFDAASGRTDTSSAQALVDHVHAQGLCVDWLLETHTHADHLTAAQWLKTQWPDALVGIGAGVRATQARFAPVFGFGPDFGTDGLQFDHLFEDDEHFHVGGIEARVITMPGHTADGIAYLIGDALFPGDTLFMPDAGTARCDFPDGDAAALYRAIRTLYDMLPATTRVFVCHDYGPGGRAPACETTLGMQRNANIHLRDGVSEEEFVALRRSRDATLSVPALLLPSLQVNICAGRLPSPDPNGIRYLRIPLDGL